MMLVRARKHHRCDLCAGPIPAGIDYVRRSIRPWDHPDNEGFSEFKAHAGCYMHWQFVGDGYDWLLPDPGDFEVPTEEPGVATQVRDAFHLHLTTARPHWRAAAYAPGGLLVIRQRGGAVRFLFQDDATLTCSHYVSRGRYEIKRYDLTDPAALDRAVQEWLAA